MKKFFMTLAAAIVAVSASAQVYMGGSVGVGSVKIAGGDAETTYKVLPEIGYNINNNWAVGAYLGFGKGSLDLQNNPFDDSTHEFYTIQPYARYTFVKSQYVNVFMDGGVAYTHYNDIANHFAVGLRPGVAVNLGAKLSFVAHCGFLGYHNLDPDGDIVDSSSAFGLDLSGENITFGLYYNF